MNKTASNILVEAANIVGGNVRGDPEDSFCTIAELWNSYVCAKFQDQQFKLSEEDVAWMMVLLKVARATTKYSRDNSVDAAGYAAIAGALGNDD